MHNASTRQPDLPLCLDIIGLVRDKWSLILLNRLTQGPLRFSELRRKAEPISQKMLTQSLRSLERYGLVTRIVQPTAPPQVSYALSQLGLSFLQTVGAICQWTCDNEPTLQNAVTVFDSKAAATLGDASQDGQRHAFSA
jgi:DNA-binding HxlR family transcriptional regulator